MIKQLCGVVLWALLALSAAPGFAATASFTPTQSAGTLECLYLSTTADATDGSVKIACGGAALKATLDKQSPCDYESVTIKSDGEIAVSCSKISVPVCTLSAPSSSPASSSFQLKASCTPAADSYIWTGGICGSVSTENCTDLRTATTTYTVTGKNAGGTGTPVSATVTITNAPTTPSNPTCTLTASPSTIAAGGSSTLIASCSPTATSYSWTGAGCAGLSGSSCSVSPATTTSYSVTGSNAGGTASPRSVTVTVGEAASSVPVCSLKAPYGVATISSPGDSITLTAECTQSPTSYNWTGTGCEAIKGSSCTAAPTANTTFSVTGTNSKGTSNASSLTVTVGTTPTSASCTLKASLSSVPVGDSYTLTAQCGSSLVTKYKWTGEGCTAESGQSTCTVKSANAGSFPYTVVFTLPSDVTYSATAMVAVTPTTPASSPVCTLSASPTSIPIGGSSTLTASCIPAGTSYVWTGAGCDSTTLATCTVSPTLAGPYPYTVKVKDSSGGTAGTASVTVKAADAAASSYQGLWLKKDESGWGISLTQHDAKIFAAIYTYDAAGQPTWYVMSDCPIQTETPSRCTGKIYKVSGGSSPGVPWNGTNKAVSEEGTGTLIFDDASHGTFKYTLNTDPVEHSKIIEKLAFSNGTTKFSTDYTDLWWTEGENGWGVALTQDQGMIFAAWYVYDDKGKPVWYTASSCSLKGTAPSGICVGTLYKSTGGSSLTANWDGSKIASPLVGSVTFQFTDANNGEMYYYINGESSTRPITRLGF